VVSVTPLDFLRTPMLWADLITKYRGTVTAAPNFAYSLLARKLAQAEDGAIVLCHDVWNTTGRAMEEVIPKLIEKGFQLVTVS